MGCKGSLNRSSYGLSSKHNIDRNFSSDKYLVDTFVGVVDSYSMQMTSEAVLECDFSSKCFTSRRCQCFRRSRADCQKLFRMYILVIS